MMAASMNIADGSIVPISMGAPNILYGVTNLLDDIVDFLPDPTKKERTGMLKDTGELFHADYDFSKGKSALVFKTIMDPFIGKYSMIKVCSGVLKTNDTLYNAVQEKEERIGKLYVLEGGKPIEVPELFAGDIGALAKLEAKKAADAQ